jgi:UDP-2,3-diacylglucosamine pyrophosphatase LpxH
MAFSHNILVISDLHLGEDLGPSATEATRLHIDLVEKQLVAFLRFYARRREDGRPWRLVINGDLVDFLAVTILPGPDDDASREEREFGLRRTPAVSVAKLERVAERHKEFFRGLARFLSRGNRVEIIPGNHDTEFHWPLIQRTFRRLVQDAWAGMSEARREGAAGVGEIGEAVGFHPWFFYEKGVAWIEHGHQYDECCSFEHQLYPRRPGGDDIILNVDSAGARYLTNYVPEAEAHQQEDWTFFGYVRFAFSVGYQGFFRLLRGYHRFATSLISTYRSVRRARRERARIHDGHFTRLRVLADTWGLGHDVLLSLDNLRRRPVIGHLRRLLSVLMLDKVLAYLPAVVLGALAIVVYGLPLGAVAAAAFAGIGFLVARWSGRGRVIDPRVNLELVSERILRALDTRFVVFGHTHIPVARKVDEDGWYYNTGTWVPSGKPGLLRAFTHCVVRTGDGGPVAELCQWRDGASRPFTPDWTGQPVRATAPRGAESAEPARVRAA